MAGSLRLIHQKWFVTRVLRTDWPRAHTCPRWFRETDSMGTRGRNDYHGRQVVTRWHIAVPGKLQPRFPFKFAGNVEAVLAANLDPKCGSRQNVN